MAEYEFKDNVLRLEAPPSGASYGVAGHNDHFLRYARRPRRSVQQRKGFERSNHQSDYKFNLFHILYNLMSIGKLKGTN